MSESQKTNGLHRLIWDSNMRLFVLEATQAVPVKIEPFGYSIIVGPIDISGRKESEVSLFAEERVRERLIGEHLDMASTGYTYDPEIPYSFFLNDSFYMNISVSIYSLQID